MAVERALHPGDLTDVDAQAEDFYAERLDDGGSDGAPGPARIGPVAGNDVENERLRTSNPRTSRTSPPSSPARASCPQPMPKAGQTNHDGVRRVPAVEASDRSHRLGVQEPHMLIVGATGQVRDRAGVHPYHLTVRVGPQREPLREGEPASSGVWSRLSAPTPAGAGCRNLARTAPDRRLRVRGGSRAPANAVAGRQHPRRRTPNEEVRDGRPTRPVRWHG